jgi:hypothetical protein
MRTTITLDPDVSEKIRERMRESRRGLKEVINQALRAGLRPNGRAVDAERFVVEPHPCGFKAGVDPDKLNQLVDELEVEDSGLKLAQ